MTLVDRDRRLARITGPAARHPGFVAPLEFGLAVQHRCRRRRSFRRESDRIGPEVEAAIGALDLELVAGAGVEAGHEKLPHAALVAQAHRMAAPVPIVEIADDADPARVRRPHRETEAGHPIKRLTVRAETAIDRVAADL